MPPKHFSKLQGRSPCGAHQDRRRGKKRRAPARCHITRQDGTERVVSNPAWALRVTLDMRAQLGDRSEPDRPVRELGLDRAVRVKRIRHAVDDAGFEDRGCAARLFERRGLRPAILHGYSLLRLTFVPFNWRRRLGFGTLASTGFRGPGSIEILALGYGTRRLRSEQKIEARGLQRLDGGAAATVVRRDLRLGWRGLDTRRPGLNMRRAVGGEWNLLVVREDRMLGGGPLRSRDARAQPLGWRSRDVSLRESRCRFVRTSLTRRCFRPRSWEGCLR